MGNQLTQPSRLAAAEAVAELGGSVTYKDSLGGGRFFKSSLCVHDDGGLVVVKVYAKRSDTPELRPYRERLLGMRGALAGLDDSHAWPVQRVYESERAAFLVRQYLHANLAQRITTRPFLTLIEKRWIAYQLLLALAQCHERSVCHGDIKAENVALTSWDWAFLVDFAPYKPTLLPADNPADFSFFFDTSGRRKCCLAPERFYDPAAGITPQQAAEASLTPAMDVFSLGCVLAELFLDGQPLFDYSRLLAYRLGGAAAAGTLAALDKVHPSVRGMVAHMVQRDPAKRHSVQQYLQEARTAALPPWLASTIHPFFASMLHLDTDARVVLATQEYAHVKDQLLAAKVSCNSRQSSSNHYEDWQWAGSKHHRTAPAEYKARVLRLLRDAAAHCDDETRLQRVLPYLVAATAEPLAAVKVVALRAVVRVLAQVRGVPPSEAKVFNEYVLPSLSLLPSEAELMVEYASCIAELAATAQAFLEQLQCRRLQHAASSPTGSTSSSPVLNYDEEMAHLRAGVERVVHDLLVGPHPETKLALLPHLTQLAAFAGRRDTADVLLPSLLTFFNSQSWQVRAAFYAAFVGVCPSLGPEGVAAIVLPFLDRLVGDPEPAVAAEALGFLASVARRGLLRKRHLLLVAMRLCSRQMLGPGVATPLRAAAIDFLAAAAGQLSEVDVYAQLLPLVLPHLAAEPLSLKATLRCHRYLVMALSPARLLVDPRYLLHASSYLSAALEQSMVAQAAGLAGPTQPAAFDGGSVRDAMSAALAAGMPGGSGTDGGMGSQHVAPWYPRGVLVAHLAEHRKCVNRLAVAGCGAFFVSASSDETVKVWDCRRLEKDVSFRSRLTYTAQTGRITSVTACQDSQSVASGSADGSIHVWRVEYAARAGGAPERYTGIISCRQATPDGSAVLDLAAWAPSMLIYSTQQGGLAAWDLRAGRDAWSLPASPVAGVVERFVLDPAAHNWLLGGSSRGQLSLWDLRFRLPVNSWQHPAGAPITALAQASAPLHRLGLSAAAGPLVYVAAGEQEVGLWDIADAKCRQVLRVLRPGNSETVRRQAPAALAPQAAGLLPSRGLDMMSRARQLAISELQTPQRRREGYRALLPTAGGQLLTAGSDRAVRCWDSGRPQQSYVVCAPPPPIPTAQVVGTAAAPDTAADASAGGAPLLAGGEGSQVSLVDVPQYTYASCSVHGVPVVEESCTLQRSSSGAAASGGDREQHLARVGWAERAAALCHQLAVTDLLRVEASEPLLLSAAADGVIKAWR
ncbi:hypothetical protein CHLNCDRAFT_134632 [Chlorella variabilis]|uniref:non-specific serine/threonine protein kinase n=1 Tax=Chlorella variabilis TaxID=554065 RepID=E1ZGE3_CHLVA|nr:hypothetical protein CHLNCDRAFT_134632 [Chlorella variabilis]EFN54741.1 hypothetical protein CHLNCDRAFT_134632 [Chlorella variabilis]|eukprot:XP_005846843.1 hypothetical protein CHLNCDRAFT_134632 [Chlorella variabilis]